MKKSNKIKVSNVVEFPKKYEKRKVVYDNSISGGGKRTAAKTAKDIKRLLASAQKLMATKRPLSCLVSIQYEGDIPDSSTYAQGMVGNAADLMLNADKFGQELFKKLVLNEKN